MLDQHETLRQLHERSWGRVCLLGVGNRWRGDDGAGSRLAAALRAVVGTAAVDAGAVPENYLEKLVQKNPDTILIADAVDFGGAAGEFRLLAPDRISPAGLSSHALSLQMTR